MSHAAPRFRILPDAIRRWLWRMVGPSVAPVSEAEPQSGTQLRAEIHAAIRRAGVESDVTTYQAIGALRMVEHDLVKMLDENENR